MKKPRGGGKKPNTKTKAKAPARKRKPDAAETTARAGNGDAAHALPPGPSAQEVDQGMADLLATHVGKLLPLLEAEKNAKSRVTKAYEIAKKEGVPKKDLKIAISLETEEGEEKLRAEIANTLKIARWMRTALGTQTDLFDPPQVALPADRHYHAGRRAAMADHVRKPPEVLAHDDAQEWMRGFDEGRLALNEERAQGFKPLADTVKALVPEATGPKIPPATDEYPAPPPIGTEPPTHREAVN